MKKINLLLGVTLIAAASGVMAHSKPLTTPGFVDMFKINTTGVTAHLYLKSTSGDLVDDGYYCENNEFCRAMITDNGVNWSSEGTFTYDIGDPTSTGAYCEFQLSDGAAWSSAELSNVQCYNGAQMSALTKDHPLSHNYTITVTKSGK